MIRQLLFLLLSTILLTAQTQPERKKRPKIGLALAGGSARGLAHVGVIKWLQTHRVPVDFVTGTSMGGLVGGLYASGLDHEEISAFITQIDWSHALASGPSFEQSGYRRKEDRRYYAGGLEFGLKGGLKLPAGLSPGHGVGLVLSRFTAPYGDLKSFDDLPTPFRCVAVDLKEGTEAVFKDGQLFDALRSTMSLPGIFAPWQVGDKTYVDGGLLNNLPVDVLRGMGADIIIAVSLAIPVPKKAPDSLLGVAGRTIDVMLSSNEHRSMGMADIVLIPNLDGLTGSDFQRAADFEPRGYEAAENKARILSMLAVENKEWEEYLRARQSRRVRSPAQTASVAVLGANDRAIERFRNLYQVPGGKTGDLATFESDLTRLTGYGKYQSAHYRYSMSGGQPVLNVITREKSHGPPFLRLATIIDGVSNEGLRFGLRGRLTLMDMGTLNSEVRADFSVGADLNGLGFEYYHRIRNSRWFIAPAVRYSDITFDVYGDKDKQAGYKLRQLGGTLDLGLAASASDEIRLGYTFAGERVSPYFGVPTFDDRRGRASKLHFRWHHEGQDNPVLPTRGLRVLTEANWVIRSAISSRAYPMGGALITWAKPLSPKFLLLTKAAGGATGNGQLSFPPLSLGGLTQLSALGRNQEFGNRLYLGEAYLLRSLFKQETLLVANRLYLAAGYEMGSSFLSYQGTQRPFNDGVLGLMGETPLGFLFFGGSYGEQGLRKFYFRLGRTF